MYREEQRRWCIRVLGHTLRSVGAINRLRSITILSTCVRTVAKGYRVRSLLTTKCCAYILIVDPNENLRSYH